MTQTEMQMHANLKEQGYHPNQFSLSREELAEFLDKGFTGPFTLCDDPDEMKANWKRQRLALFDRSKVAYLDAQPGTGVYDYDRHLDNSFLADVICRPQIVHRICSILGPDVLCFRTEFFPKYPGDEGTDWHQVDTFGSLDRIPHIQWPNGSDFGRHADFVGRFH